MLQLDRMNKPFDELIVIASGLSAAAFRRVNMSLRSLSDERELKIIRVPLGSVGANRNRGFSAASTDLITYLDSDDSYSSDYVTFIKDAFARSPFDIMLHTCSVFSGPGCQSLSFARPPAIEKVPLITSANLHRRSDVDWEQDPRGFGDTGLWPISIGRDWPFHQGHMTLRRDISLRFHEDPMAKNEDGVFLNRALMGGMTLNIYDASISAYRQGSSANPMRYRIARLCSKIGRFLAPASS